MTNTTNTTTDIDFRAIDADTLAAIYTAATPSEKAAIRSARASAVAVAVTDTDLSPADRIAVASHIIDLEAVCVAAKSTASTVDYVAKIRDMRATLVAAVAAIDAGEVVMPDGIDVPDIDGMEGGTVDTSAVRRFVTVTGRKSGRGDVTAWITGAVDHIGRLATIADLRGSGFVNDDYPTSAPSAGAVAAAFDRIIDAGTDVDFVIGDIDGVRAAGPVA